MGDVWLPGFERIPNAKNRGGTYASTLWRFVAHTTEVVPSSLNGARAMAERHENPPQLWAWPAMKWRAQTIPLNRSGFALLHPSGTPETNKMGAIQVEIIGLAGETPGWPEAWWTWLGEEVLRPVVDAGFAIDLANVAPTTGDDGAGVDGKVRMTRQAWAAFDGVCCHANVPDNHHWDIGAGRLDLIAAAAAREDDDMGLSDEDKVWLHSEFVEAAGRARVSGPDGPNPTEERSDVWRWTRETVGIVRLLAESEGHDVDEAAIASAVLAGLSPEKIAEAIPDTIAKDVADELAARLDG